MGFLDKGSLLKHRNLGFDVMIIDIVQGQYLLGWANPLGEDPWARHLLSGKWTAADIVRDFNPQIQSSKWDRLLDDDILQSEDDAQLEV